MKRLVALAILAVPLAACTDQANNRDFVRYVASNVKKDCVKALPQAPNDARRLQLLRLCDCTEQKILATHMGLFDNDQTVSDKVQGAMKVCFARLGGTPGEKGR